jgi:hypothetical protein
MKGKGRWHEKERQENLEKIKKTLLKVQGGLTKSEIFHRCRLSRPTIDKLLPILISIDKVIKIGRRFYWKSTLDKYQEWSRRLDNLLVKMIHDGEDPKLFLHSNCIAFIGYIPLTFPKSVRGIQEYIMREKDLERRFSGEREPLLEKYMQIRQKHGKGSKESLDFLERIGDEVGSTVEEYLEKLLKKAEKQKGVRKICTVLGIDYETFEEMYKQYWKSSSGEIKT